MSSFAMIVEMIVEEVQMIEIECFSAAFSLTEISFQTFIDRS